MPREVIMPALGMAQDVGVIVSWLKAPGDAIAEGDPLMEVETDKATMEIEAPASGYLTGVRAAAGESVPVGRVVAVISESADDPGEAPGAAEATGEDEAAAPDGEVAGRKVIMPALGMAQDTGRIVAWLKAPGDRVAEGDAIFEVETDKATMEVEAEAAGWIAATYAVAGEDVPVGEVIAVIAPTEPASPVARSRADAPAGGAPAAPPERQNGPAANGVDSAGAAGPEPAAKAVRTANVQARSDGGRILASPKARRLAAERGLELSRLADAGHPGPYHVADLDTLADLQARSAAITGASGGAATLRLDARVPAAALDELAELAGTIPPLASLAAGALRAATEAERIVVRYDRPGQPSEIRHDPDYGGGPAPGDARADLVVRDLTGTRITAATLGAAEAPVLTVTRDGGELVLALEALPGTMDADLLLRLATGLAERLEDPLRQLL